MAAIVLSCFRYNYKLPEASESFESTGISLIDIELSQGDISYYNSEYLGDFFRIYCVNCGSALSDVKITVITKDSTKEFYYAYIPSNEIFTLIVLSRNSENTIIKAEYSECEELNKTDKCILGTMRAFYQDGIYLGASYKTIPDSDFFYYLEEK